MTNTIEQYYILITRQGIKTQGETSKKKNLLTPTSILNLQDIGSELSDFLSEKFYPEDLQIDHSGSLRALRTAKAILYGMSKYAQVKTNFELDHLLGLCYKLVEDPRLNYPDSFSYNEPAFERIGEKKYNTHWINNPDETRYKNKQITPFIDIMTNARAYLAHVFAETLNPDYNKKLRMVGSHSGIVEAMMFTLVNSARQMPVQKAKDIGGLFLMEENFLVILEHNTDSDKYSALLDRHGNKYDIDINNVRNVA